ncbi:MAG: NAD-dependent epimerase/dehydratase family protein [Deltaproteobacteria bacterium]|nr:NAD-dependent epimerase/dehydratase family protein [Deltaproteobacteria bacterium]
MRALLTGAAGFIGSHLAERLCGRGDRVTGFDNFDPFYAREVKERNLAGLLGREGFSLVEGDLVDPHDVDRAFDVAGQVDTVVHLAALAGVRPSIASPGRYWNVNVNGTLHLLHACRTRGVKRIVFASSSSVYGLDSQVPFCERQPCNRPLSPYAATKRAGELMAWNHHYLYGAAVTCLRYFTVYGPRQRPDLAIHKFTRLLAAGQPIELFGDGTTSRDYTWIDDILDGTVAAIDELANDGDAAYRVYNLGGSQPTSLKELVDRIASALGRPAVLAWKPEQPGDMKHTLADIELARSALGYSPKVSIAAGIPRFVAWWRSANR